MQNIAKISYSSEEDSRYWFLTFKLNLLPEFHLGFLCNFASESRKSILKAQWEICTNNKCCDMTWPSYFTWSTDLKTSRLCFSFCHSSTDCLLNCTTKFSSLFKWRINVEREQNNSFSSIFHTEGNWQTFIKQPFVFVNEAYDST